MSAAKRHLVVASALLTLSAIVPAVRAEEKTPSLAERVQILDALKEKPAAGSAQATAAPTSAPAPASATVTAPAPAANPLASPLPDPNAPAVAPATVPAGAAPAEQASAVPPTLPPAAIVPSTVRPDLSATDAPKPAPIFNSDPAPGTAEHAAPRSAASPATYTIKSGDTFETIAKAKLGDARKWNLIAKANPLVDPIRLKVGQTIRLPQSGDAAEASTPTLPAHAAHAEHSVTKLTHTGLPTHAGAAAHATVSDTVTVKPGESLNSIARRIYGTSTMWPAIYHLNRDKLHDPDELRPGMVLKLPAGHRR